MQEKMMNGSCRKINENFDKVWRCALFDCWAVQYSHEDCIECKLIVRFINCIANCIRGLIFTVLIIYIYLNY